MSGTNPPEATPPSAESLGWVTDWCQVFEKTLKNFRTYSPGHPTVVQFMARLFQKTDSLLEKIGDLTLTVGPHALMFSEEVVLQNEEKQNNFCFRLHQDGVRQLTFRKELTHEELEGFLGILRTDFGSYEHCDDDVVTLLWKHEFEHVSYVVADSLIEVGGGTVLEEALRRGTDEWTRSELPPSIREALRTEAAHPRKLKQADTAELTRLPEPTIPKENPMTEEISSGLRNQIDADDDALIQKTLVLLFKVLVRQEQKADFDAIGSLLKKLTASLIGVGRFSLAAKILTKLRDFARDPIKAGPSAEFVVPFYDSFGGAEVAGEIQNPVLAPAFDSFAELAQLVGAFPTSAFDILFELFRITSRDAIRKALVPALSLSVGVHITKLQSALNAAGKDLALEILGLVDTVGPSDRAPLLRRALRHTNASVRLKALEFTALEPVDSVRGVFQTALRDADSVVRVKALRYLVHVKDFKSSRAVFDVVRDKMFDERDLEEKKGFFMALAALGGSNLLEFFRQELDRGLLSRSEKDTDRRIASAHAMALIGTPASRKILEEIRGQKTLPARVRTACEEVLAAWPKGKPLG